MKTEVVLSGALIVGALAVFYVLRRAARDADAFSAFARDFYERVDRILDRRDIPPVVTDFLLFIGGRIRWRLPVWRLLFDIITGRLRKKMESDKGRQHRWDIMKVRAQVPDDLRETFDFAMAAFFLAVTSNSPIAGPVVRRILLATVPRIDVSQVHVDREAQALVSEIGDRRLSAA